MHAYRWSISGKLASELQCTVRVKYTQDSEIQFKNVQCLIENFHTDYKLNDKILHNWVKENIFLK